MRQPGPTLTLIGAEAVAFAPPSHLSPEPSATTTELGRGTKPPLAARAASDALLSYTSTPIEATPDVLPPIVMPLSEPFVFSKYAPTWQAVAVKPVTATFGFWERLTQLAGLAGTAGLGAVFQDWRAVLAFCGGLAALTVVGLLLHNRIVAAVKDIRSQINT